MTTETVVAGDEEGTFAGPARNLARNARYVNEFGQWQGDEMVTNCLKCQTNFSFLVRKHHCRCCGRIYCSSCSSRFAWYDRSRVKVVLRSEDDYEIEPFRTCDSCYDNLMQMKLLQTPWGDIVRPSAANRARLDTVRGLSSRIVETEIESSNSSSIRPFEVTKNGIIVENVPEAGSERSSAIHIQAEDYGRCPICNFDLKVLGSDETKQQEHVSACIEQAEIAQQCHDNIGSPTYQNRMLVYKIPKNVENVIECPICFEDMGPNQKVGRLECLCVFHYDCIKSWFRKKTQKLAAQSSVENNLALLGKNYCPFHDAVF